MVGVAEGLEGLKERLRTRALDYPGSRSWPRGAAQARSRRTTHACGRAAFLNVKRERSLSPQRQAV